MDIINKKSLLRILNPNAKTRHYPAFSHLDYNGKRYPIKNREIDFLKSIEIVGDNEYIELEVVISGKIESSLGNMPNPMVFVEAIELSDIKIV